MADQKRKRADTHGTAVPTQLPHPTIPNQASTSVQHDLNDCIEALDSASLKRLLLQAANAQPAIAALLRSNYDELLQRERSRVIDFDDDSKSVWYSLNKEHSRLSGSKQYDISGDVYTDVADTIESIGEQAGSKNASFGTKQSGLETLRKIGKTICLSGDVIGHEVRKLIRSPPYLEDSMLAILGVMTEVEKEIMCDVNDGRSSFLEKMEELEDLASGYWTFKKLGKVVQELRGYGEDEETSGDEEEE